MFVWLHDWLGRDSADHLALTVIEAHILERPQDWTRCQYWFQNAEKSIAFWISNGLSHLNLRDTKGATHPIYAPETTIPWYWRRRFWRAIRRANAPTAKLEDMVNRFKGPRASGEILAFKRGTQNYFRSLSRNGVDNPSNGRKRKLDLL